MAENFLPLECPQAERAVIGCMLIDDFAGRRARQILGMGDFFDVRLRYLFEAIEALKEASPDLPVDVVTVSDYLRQRGELEKAGGADTIKQCIDEVVSAAHVEHYVRFVKDASIQRQISQQLEITYSERTPDNHKRLGDLILQLQGNRGARIFDMREDLGPMIEEILEKPKKGTMTGFKSFDLVTDGIVQEEVWVLGARPGAGKTAFMLKSAANIAQRLALNGNPGKESVLYLTTEMTVRSLVQRILPMVTGIPHTKFRSGSLSKDEIGLVLDACRDGLDTFPLKIMGRPRLSIDDIKGAVYQAKPSIVFIDYLQRCQLPKSENRAYAIEGFMADLKSFMVDTGLKCMIGCQTDRELDRFPDVEPQLAHLKGSGGIESEADGVALLWEPSPSVVAKRADWVNPRPNCRAIEGFIRKARSGAKDVVFDLQLEGELIKMTDRLPPENYTQGEFNG